MDIRERLTELYDRRMVIQAGVNAYGPESSGAWHTELFELDQEIDFLEARYRDQLETQFAMQYATDRAAERAEAGEVGRERPHESFEMTPNGLF